jgi:preprotein translocase subunit SecG
VTLFVILHVLICVSLIGVILIQQGKGDAGIGFGSSSQTIFGSKGAGNFLTKTTSVLAAMFLTTSFILTRSRIQQYSGSVIKNEAAQPKPAVPPSGAAPAPKAPAGAPAAAGSKAPEGSEPAKR